MKGDFNLHSQRTVISNIYSHNNKVKKAEDRSMAKNWDDVILIWVLEKRISNYKRLS